MQYRLGVVLSGGGSRGIAHIGVLRALAEHGIHPDCVSGSSAGAIVGALYCAGLGWDEMLDFFVSTSPFKLSKFALGKPGLLDTEKIVPDFLPYFPRDSFEALGKRLFATATDLVAGRPEVFTSGPLVRAIIASSSFPMVFTPTRVGDRLFIDGGVIDNFPVSPLLGICDVILGVHASPLSRRSPDDLENSFAIGQRALEIGMYYASKRHFHQCDLVITPTGMEGFGLFDARRRVEIHDLGYRAASARMAQIEALLSATSP
jgi:NTE family protein